MVQTTSGVISLLAILFLAFAVAAQPIYPSPPPSSGCQPCNQPIYSNYSGGVSVYCCKNEFKTTSDPITCMDNQGPWKNPNSCNVAAFAPPPPGGSPPPPAIVQSPKPSPPFPPTPAPPPACPANECSSLINVTSEGSTHGYYCCSEYYMITDGCLTCTSKHGHAEGPFTDPQCSYPVPDHVCTSGSRATIMTAFTLFSILISLIGAFYL